MPSRRPRPRPDERNSPRGGRLGAHKTVAGKTAQDAPGQRTSAGERHDPLGFLAGDGEMKERIHSCDWSQTPMGPAAEWPQSLKTVLRIMLDSRYAMWLGWGPGLTFFYNDAYARMTLGPKHPGVLGRFARDVWPEIWGEIGPLAESVVQTGEATFDERLLLFLERQKLKEETYHTFSYSPVLDDQGNVGGMLCVVTEETERTIGERRLKTLQALAANTIERVQSIDEACRTAARTLADDPHDLPFALIYLLDADRTTARLAGAAGLAVESPGAPSTIDLKDGETAATWPLDTVLDSGRSVEVTQLAGRFGDLRCGIWPEPPQQAVVLPLHRPGQAQLAGFFVVGISPRLVFDDRYRGFLELLGGQIATAIANARALDEERQRVKTLAELDRAKTAFFSNVSHEFRTPLTLMLGLLEDALSQPAGAVSDLVREDLTTAHRNSLRLLKLVNTLLDFSRIEASRVEPHFEATDLARFTRELASGFRSAVDRAGLRLVIDCPLDEHVYVDCEMWEKIVLNLLSNALKYTFDGEIVVRLARVADTAELSVRDTGTGIPAEERGRLFERFHRIQGAKARTHEGTGIGLALVQELVKLHGGTVRVDSQVDHGTTFYVALPLGKNHLPADRIGAPRALESTALGATPFLEEALRWLPAEETTERPTRQAPRPTSAPHPTAAPVAERREAPSAARVLVVDDNTDLREYVRRLLSAHYDVEAVADGQAALAAARREKPDLIVTDAMMPRLDGFGLLREVRADRALRDVPLIMLSARAGEEARVEGAESGVDDYLVKPFSARELLARVRTLVAMARMRREASSRLEQEIEARKASSVVEARLGAIVESSDDAIVSKTLDGIITSWNAGAQNLFGYTPEEAIGQSILLIVPPERHKEEATILARLRKGERIQHFETVRMTKDGRRVDISLSVSPVRDSSGTIVGASKIARDITDKKRAEREKESLLEAERNARAEAQRTNQMKDEFLATLSHELRTPLNAIMGWAQLMGLGTMSDEELKEAGRVIERNARTQKQLIDDLLDMSRIISGKLRLDLQQIEPISVVEAAIETIRPSAAVKDIRIEKLLDPFAGPVSGDPARLQQVVWNLLSNAVKFTPKGGRIQVRLQKINSHIEVTVSDTGQGIDPAFLPYLFERFRQADASTSRKHGGLGIGLAIVKEIVELHGGTVSAMSEGPGNGATLVVTLPLLAIRGGLRPRRVHPAAPSVIPIEAGLTELSGLKVLFVDDEADARGLVKRLLEECGAEVVTATNASEAIDLAIRSHPEVVISDIGMPEVDGYEFLRQLRMTGDAAAQVPAIALTAFARTEDRTRALRAGYIHHVSKPIEPSELLATVAVVTGRLPR